MKRKLLLLALALLYLFTAAALAEETTDVNLGNVGLHFKLPFSPDKTIGTFDIPFSDAFDNEGNTFFAIFQYYAKDIAVNGAKDLEGVSEEIKTELMRESYLSSILHLLTAVPSIGYPENHRDSKTTAQNDSEIRNLFIH